MKNKIISMFFTGVLVTGISFTASAASTVESLLGQLSKGADTVCRKANFFDFKFSIRSGNGAACNTRLVAAVAELVCKPRNTDNYMDSQCHAKAERVIGTENPATVLATELKNLGTSAMGLACGAKGSIPALSSVCTMINK